jgi:protein-L-isoaspartate(D-aspartate) O-methyltransferase
MESVQTRRERMVAHDIEGSGVHDLLVLDAFRRVPREEFVDPGCADHAYDDARLPISYGQTDAPPSAVARGIEALSLPRGARVLEIGTGSGYIAAILAQFAREVYTIERMEDLAREAIARLYRLGYRNVRIFHGVGSQGLPRFAPYHGIFVAQEERVASEKLVRQLVVGGRLVMPSIERGPNALTRITRTGPETFEREELGEPTSH